MNPERAIQTVEEQPVIQADASTIMQIIGRAASDQSIDIEKLERLAAMYERLTDRQAVQAYGAAMSAAQAETGRVSADASNPQTKSKYASYAALDRELRPIYTRHGFALSFGTADGAPPECVRVTCLVAHAEGHRETYHIDMPADGKGAKGGDVMTKTHAMGAAASYGQRYLLKLIFNIAVGEDSDGNGPTGPSDWINDEQVDELVALMDEVGADRGRFLNFLKIDTLAHLPKQRLAYAIAQLEKKRAV